VLQCFTSISLPNDSIKSSINDKNENHVKLKPVNINIVNV